MEWQIRITKVQTISFNVMKVELYPIFWKYGVKNVLGSQYMMQQDKKENCIFIMKSYLLGVFSFWKIWMIHNTYRNVLFYSYLFSKENKRKVSRIRNVLWLKKKSILHHLKVSPTIHSSIHSSRIKPKY